MNVLNYFNGDGQGGGFPAPRGAPTYAEFLRQRTKIITATVTLNADILGLMEIENDGDDSLSAIQDLVNGINDATAPGTYAFIAEPAPGTDQIKVAMIYKPGEVTPVGAAINYQVDNHPVYTPLYDRPPLVQQFTVNATGQSLFVIVNHFKSKGSCPTSPTDPDADYGQGCWNAKRVAQANGLLDLIADLRNTTGEPDALIIGDLNAYGGEDPILALTHGGMVNELATRVAAEERYTYIFDGQSGYLDNALATLSLDAQIRGATIWHINADEPEILSYLAAGFELYSETPYRSSDHDPVLIGLDLSPLKVYLPLVDRIP
jgi:predicted extracellular nuclease